ncbi:hypothetical protein LINPERPRIM_LOCUS11509 [Linum perenne]
MLCCCHLYCSSARFGFWSLPVVLVLVVGVIINFPGCGCKKQG